MEDSEIEILCIKNSLAIERMDKKWYWIIKAPTFPLSLPSIVKLPSLESSNHRQPVLKTGGEESAAVSVCHLPARESNTVPEKS